MHHLIVEYHFYNPALWYRLPAQARAFLNLKNSAAYRRWVVDPEINLFSEHASALGTLLQRGGAYKVVDLGCGDGVPTFGAMKHLEQVGVLFNTYVPIDSSEFMISTSLANARAQGLHTTPTPPTCMFDTEAVRANARLNTEARALFFMLGSTILNYDVGMVLRSFSALLNPGDLAFIGVTLRQYESFAVRSALEARDERSFFEQLLPLLDVAPSSVAFFERKRGGKIESCFTCTAPGSAKFEDQQLDLEVGDVIVVGYTHLYSFAAVSALVLQHFDQAKVFPNAAATNCIVVLGA